jgi:hypothetical protein
MKLITHNHVVPKVRWVELYLHFLMCIDSVYRDFTFSFYLIMLPVAHDSSNRMNSYRLTINMERIFDHSHSMAALSHLNAATAIPSHNVCIAEVSNKRIFSAQFAVLSQHYPCVFPK